MGRAQDMRNLPGLCHLLDAGHRTEGGEGLLSSHALCVPAEQLRGAQMWLHHQWEQLPSSGHCWQPKQDGSCHLSTAEAAEAQREEMEGFSKPRSEPSTIPPIFPWVLGLRGTPSRLESSALWDIEPRLERAAAHRRWELLAGAAGPEWVPVSSSHRLWKTLLQLLKLCSLYSLIKRTPALGPSQSWGEGGYLQPKSDVQGAPGCPPGISPGGAPARDSITGSVWELPAEGDGQPPARLPQIWHTVLESCNCCSSGFSVLPASKVCQLLWHLLSWLCIFTAVEYLWHHHLRSLTVLAFYANISRTSIWGSLNAGSF